MPSKLNAWSRSKKVGLEIEKIVRDALNSLGNTFELNNRENVKQVDLSDGQMTIEVKSAFSPFPRKKTPAGLTNDKHLTLDEANIKKYKGVVLIVIAVVYPETKGLYVIPAGKVKAIIKENPNRIYERSGRTPMDKIKKVGISIDECQRIDVDDSFIKRIEAIASKAES